jgi:hypothetical protein
MKLMYGNTPVKSLNIHTYEKDTNDATMIASDLQAGVTAYARGQKITGTGKTFSFASYGTWFTNESNIVPTSINVIQIGSIEHPVRMTIPFQNMKIHNFAVAQKMAEVTIDGVNYPMIVSVQNNEFVITCDKTVEIQLFIGKDEYI